MRLFRAASLPAPRVYRSGFGWAPGLLSGLVVVSQYIKKDEEIAERLKPRSENFENGQDPLRSARCSLTSPIWRQAWRPRVSCRGWICPCSSEGTSDPCATCPPCSSFQSFPIARLHRIGDDSVPNPAALKLRYCFSPGAVSAGVAGDVSPFRIVTAVGGSGLSALASRMLTCHICVSVSNSL